MEIPRYWACTPQQVRLDGDEPVTVDMWGWSDHSLEAARAHSQQRADWLKTGKFGEGRWYPQYPSGALREEVLQRFEDAGELQGAITRNRYGAAVLNTRDVVMVDIDDASGPGGSAGGGGLLGRLFGRRPPAGAGPLDGFRAYRDANPGLSYRLYRTAAGYRLFVLDGRHAPGSGLIQDLMTAVGADPLYVKLCRGQRCYRARLTPKPWRIGLPSPHLRHPCEDPELARWQAEWIAEYENARRGHAVAELVESRGGTNDARIQHFLALHDHWCVSSSAVPLA